MTIISKITNILYYFIILVVSVIINCQYTYLPSYQSNNYLPMVPSDFNIFKLELKVDKIINIEKKNFEILEKHIKTMKSHIHEFEKTYREAINTIQQLKTSSTKSLISSKLPKRFETTKQKLSETSLTISTRSPTTTKFNIESTSIKSKSKKLKTKSTKKKNKKHKKNKKY